LGVQNNFVLFLKKKNKKVKIAFSCQDLGTQIKRDVPVKDAKTRANKTEETSKKKTVKYLRQVRQQKSIFCSAKVCAVLSDHPITALSDHPITVLSDHPITLMTL
jgi:hypothetical protein